VSQAAAARAADTFDYIVVGAGSAGCVMANRLSEDGASVLLLEAGDWDRDPLIHVPIAIGKIFPERLHDWGYFFEQDPGLDTRGIECARGKVIGGSSSVNVMAYVRGHRGDYERWAASGLSGWSYADVLPYFRRSETWEGGADAYRGGSGPLKVRRTRYDDALLASFIQAGSEAGYAVTKDYNGAEQEGFDFIQQTIHRGRRCSAAVAYLHPILKRPALRVVVKAMVERVVLEQGRACGVSYSVNGQAVLARATREVILCGGVIDTPKLLMLSGIGDPAQLAAHGIAVQLANPYVGANLQDHLSVMLSYRRRDRGPFTAAMRYDRLARAMLTSWLGGESFASDVPTGVTAFVKSAAEKSLPDVQFLFLSAPLPAHPWFRPFSQPVADGFGCRVVLLRPESRGKVTLASGDPRVAPLLTPNFLTSENDRATLRRGMRMLREVMAQSAMSRHVEAEIAPGPATLEDPQLDAYVRKTSVTVHHPAGTCRMGGPGDAQRVVDAELRVCGVEGLRVVDASVMPDLVGGNINAVVVMIAEKAADLVRGRTPATA
jgi:choline dehydrogenase/4-pyridoxate dehydrogenase